MKYLIWFCLFTLFVVGAVQSIAQRDERGLKIAAATANEKRVALVIGNGAYAKIGRLRNPPNDALDIATALQNLGFQVIHKQDLTQRGMKRAIQEFGALLSENAVALFYYAGHGAQLGGENYLLPVDAEVSREADIPLYGVDMSGFLAQIEAAHTRCNIIILDACRNNPFEGARRAASGGLAKLDAPGGTFVAYSTAPGRTADDNPEGRNGLYTQELLKHIQMPGLTIEQTFKRVLVGVREKSGGLQLPWTASALDGEFYFAGALSNSNSSALPITLTPPVTPTTPPSTKPSVRMSEAGVPLAAMNFVTVSVDASGTVKNRRQEQGYGFVEDLGSGVKLQMVEIPGGTFQMGSTNRAAQKAFAEAKRYDKDTRFGWFTHDQPQHQVRVSGFAMGSYEVTQAQWQAIMGNNPAQFKGDMNLPIEQVRWEEAQEFCRKLSARTGRGYRLPTEAEWEYAARAGTTTAFAFGDTISTQIENYNGIYLNQQAAKDSFRTKSVGSLRAANGFGLSDMHGNVAEWCEDMWHESYVGAPSNGSAWVTGDDNSKRVVRGGAWGLSASYCRSASRAVIQPGVTSLNNIGLRVVVSARNQ